jgi:hypothetical protein
MNRSKTSSTHTTSDPSGIEPAVAMSARAMYRALSVKGMRSDEAANLTAVANGLSPVESGWSIQEIGRLLFLRHLVDHEHIRG